MKPQSKVFGAQTLLYDAETLAHPMPGHFEPDWWRAQGRLSGQAQSGRGATWFVQPEGREERWALRHYRRGGLIAKLIYDHYLWMGLAHTRAWREWHLTAHLFGLGLPVPRPVAARVRRSGLLYRADLLTAVIPEVRQLTDWLGDIDLPLAEWRALGQLLRRFHQAGLDHHDLNCDNLLRRADGSLFLLDFDRCHLRQPGAWQAANLARLQRSLLKRQRQGRVRFFTEDHWQSLLAGYSC